MSTAGAACAAPTSTTLNTAKTENYRANTGRPGPVGKEIPNSWGLSEVEGIGFRCARSQ